MSLFIFHLIGLTKPCEAPGCDREFKYAADKRRACSPSCYRRLDRPDYWICEHRDCGKQFESRHKKRFCSRNCARAEESRRAGKLPLAKQIKCSNPNCDTSFDQVQINQKYCSQRCKNHVTGHSKDSPHQRAFRRIRPQVIKRDMGTCCDCGGTHEFMDVHHIDHDTSNNQLSNLILLCRACHNRYGNTDKHKVMYHIAATVRTGVMKLEMEA